MKKDWYISYSTDEVLIAPESVAASIVQTCRRKVPGRAVAMLQQGEHFTVVITPVESILQATADFRFVEITSTDHQELLGLLEARWQGGYHATGMLALPAADGGDRWFIGLQKPTEAGEPG